MHAKTRDLLTLGWWPEANLSFFLLLLILAGFVLPSLGIRENNLPLYGDIAFSVVLLVGAALAWEDRRLFVLTSPVVSVAIVLRWVKWWMPTNMLLLWSVATGLAAILTVTAVLFWRVFRRGPITAARVQGAIAAYLCLGFAWAHAYHLLALSDPGAFNAAGSDVSATSTWVNYSFGMLTTVGYGGIVAIHPVAHSLGSGEALMGQLYLAVLVARLVSVVQVSARREPEATSIPKF
jgi:hypothetical protein